MLNIYVAYYNKSYTEAKNLCKQYKNIEGYNIKSSIEFIESEYEKSLNTLNFIPEDVEKTAETYRLLAIMELIYQHDLHNAKEMIASANKLSPEWESVQGISAIISFWEACIPIAINEVSSLLNPQPFPPSFFKVDDKSRGFFESLAKEFSSLSELEILDEQIFHYRTWTLISLIASGQTSQASVVFDQLLDSKYDISPYIFWCQSYDVKFDKEKVITYLLSISTNDHRYLNYQGVYCSFLIGDNQADKALKKLEVLKPEFNKQNRMNALYIWRSDAYKFLKMYEKEKVELLKLPKSSDLEVSFLNIEKHLSGEDTNNTAYLDSLLKIYERNKAPLTLFNICETAASQKQWKIISPYKVLLLEQFPIPAAISLVAYTEFSLRNANNALSVLQDNIDKFPKSTLPSDLKILEIRCLQTVSQFDEALKKAKLLTKESNTAVAYITLLDLLVIMGDKKGITDIADKFLSFDNITGGQLLQVSNLTKLLNVPVSEMLWRKAVSLGSNDPAFSISAYILGQTFDINSQDTAPLLHKAIIQTQDNRQSLLKSVSFKEARSILKSYREQSEKNVEMYIHGEIPIHILPKNVLQPLSVLFYSNPKACQMNYDPVYSVPVWGRHGSRSINWMTNFKINNIYLDYTALLLAEHIGILDSIINLFSAIYLPHNTQQFLLSEIDALEPTQFQRLAAMKKIQQLVDEQAIELIDIDEINHEELDSLTDLLGWTTARELIFAKKKKGLLVEYLPIRDHENEVNIKFPSKWKDYITDISSIINDLNNRDILPIDYDEIIQKFTKLDDKGINFLRPKKRQCLIISPTILIQYAEYNLLDTISRRYHLSCNKNQWNRELLEIKNYNLNGSTNKWIKKLYRKICDGIGKKEILLIPENKVIRDNVTLLHEGMSNIFNHSFKENDLVWIDDRHMTGYSFMNAGSKIISSIDALKILYKNKSISKEKYYNYIIKLREMNYRYIPFSKQEILFWLRKVPTKKNQVVESKELKILRQYWNACLWSNNFLLPWQKIPKNQVDETSFILQGMFAVTEAISDTWGDRRLNIKRQMIRSQWLLDSLYISFSNLKQLPPDSNSNDVISGDISRLLSIGMRLPFQINKGKESKKSLQAVFIQWIYDHFILPRLKVDPDCIKLITESMSIAFLSMLSSTKDEEKNIFRTVISQFIFSLPIKVRDNFLQNDDFIDKLNLHVGKTVSFGGFTFKLSAFIEAVEKILAFEYSELECVNKSQVLTIAPIEDHASLYDFTLNIKGENTTTQHLLARSYHILSRSKDTRLQLLNDNPYIIDALEENIADIEQLLSNIEDFNERIDKLDQIQNASAETHYVSLKQELNNNRNSSVDVLLPPSLISLQKYFRVDCDIRFDKSSNPRS